MAERKIEQKKKRERSIKQGKGIQAQEERGMWEKRKGAINERERKGERSERKQIKPPTEKRRIRDSEGKKDNGIDKRESE